MKQQPEALPGAGPPTDDQTLLHRAASGDTEALGMLYDRVAWIIQRIAR